MRLSEILDPLLGEHIEASGQLRYECPFCHSPNNKFYINADGMSKKFGLWVCFECEKSGNLLELYKQLRQIDYAEAKDELFNAGFSLDYVPYDKELSNNENIIKLLGDSVGSIEQETSSLIRNQPPPLPVGLNYLTGDPRRVEEKPYWDYLLGRGLSKQAILFLNTGYVDNGYALTSKGKPLYLHKHVIFFTYKDNKYQYWNTRSIIKDAIPKAVNAPNGGNLLCYGKEDSVFNGDVAFKQSFVVLTEGVPDALTLFPYGIATFGKQVSDKQIDYIVNSIKPETKLLLMLDMDAKDLLVRLATRVYPKHANTYIVYNQTKRDANSLGYEEAFKVIENNLYPADKAGRVAFILRDKCAIM